MTTAIARLIGLLPILPVLFLLVGCSTMRATIPAGSPAAMAPLPPPPSPSEPAGLEERLSPSYALLPTGEKEQSGFGLYSYLLLPSHEPSVEAIYKAATRILLPWLNPTANLIATGADPRTLTVTYLLTTRRYQPEAPYPTEKDIDWLARNADVARATALLRMLPGPANRILGGPFLVIYRAPLLGSGATPTAPIERQKLYLLDLTGAGDESVLKVWLNSFLLQASTPTYWDVPAFTRFNQKTDRALMQMASLYGLLTEAAPKVSTVWIGSKEASAKPTQ